MYDLNPDDMLSKIHQYKLDRPDGWCYISVHEVIASEKANIKYIAVPNIAVHQAENQFFGTGETLEDALAACLAIIKSVDIHTLFPNLREAYGAADNSGDSEPADNY